MAYLYGHYDKIYDIDKPSSYCVAFWMSYKNSVLGIIA